MRWWLRASVVAAAAMFLLVCVGSPVQAHHRSEYYWVAGLGNPLGPGGNNAWVPGSEYTVGGVSFFCPLRDCTVSMRNQLGGPAPFDICGRNSPGSQWSGCALVFGGSKRMIGYQYLSAWPAASTAISGTFDVYAKESATYGFGLERSYARLGYVDMSPRTGTSSWELAGLPSPGCYRHFLDVNQDGNVVSAGWLQQAGPAILPDLFFFNSAGVRIGAQLNLFYGETPLPFGTAAIMACNKGTVGFGWLFDVPPPVAPLLMLQISRPSI